MLVCLFKQLTYIYFCSMYRFNLKIKIVVWKENHPSKLQYNSNVFVFSSQLWYFSTNRSFKQLTGATLLHIFLAGWLGDWLVNLLTLAAAAASNIDTCAWIMHRKWAFSLFFFFFPGNDGLVFYLRWEQKEAGAGRSQRLLQGETRHWCFVLESEALMWYVGQMAVEEGGWRRQESQGGGAHWPLCANGCPLLVTWPQLGRSGSSLKAQQHPEPLHPEP